MLLPIQPGMRKGKLDKFADRVGFSSTDNEVVRGFLLQHQPHGADIVRSVSPIPVGVEIAEVKLLLNTVLDVGDGASNLTGDKRLAAAWRLVIEQDTARCVEPIALPIVHRDVVPKGLGARVGAAGVESRGLALGRSRATEHLA